jgi:hypothetical protein
MQEKLPEKEKILTRIRFLRGTTVGELLVDAGMNANGVQLLIDAALKRNQKGFTFPRKADGPDTRITKTSVGYLSFDLIFWVEDVVDETATATKPSLIVQ